MFGYIRPVKSELYVKDNEFYSSVYCGLCHYGGKNVSPLTRWLLNYDFVFLALLRTKFTKESICINKKRCPYTLKNKNCVCADESFAFVCSAFGLLTYEKILDDIKDERGLKRFCKKIITPFFRKISKKSNKFDGLKEIICSGTKATEEAERSKCASPDKAADGFATMMKEIVSFGLEGKTKIIAENCGYHIGRFIYLADAFDDIDDDAVTGNYNPFITHYGSKEKAEENTEAIRETLYDSMNAFSNYYALAVEEPIDGVDRLIFNITELGGRAAVQRIIERKHTK